MKGEERIIELLSEYLVKADRNENEIKQNQKQIELLRKDFIENQGEIKKLRSESLKHDIRQDVLLKEILSLSKRVGDLERQ